MWHSVNKTHFKKISLHYNCPVIAISVKISGQFLELDAWDEYFFDESPGTQTKIGFLYQTETCLYLLIIPVLDGIKPFTANS